MAIFLRSQYETLSYDDKQKIWESKQYVSILNGFIRGEFPDLEVTVVGYVGEESVGIYFLESQGETAEEKLKNLFIDIIENNITNPALVILPKGNEDALQSKRKIKKLIKQDKIQTISLNTEGWKEYKLQAQSVLMQEKKTNRFLTKEEK